MSIIATISADSGTDPLVLGLRRLLKHVHMSTEVGGRSPRHYDAGSSDALDEVEYRLETDLRMSRAA